jgi:hypothetical protein
LSENVVLVHALLTILFRSDTYGGRVHEKPIANATPSRLPARSQLLQDLGFLALTLPHVGILLPTKQPRGQALSLELPLAHQALFADGAWSMSTAVCSVVASSQTGSACGRRASAMW